MPIDTAGKIAIAFGATLLFLATQYVREVNPTAGRWSVIDGTIDGQQLANPGACRIYMEIDTSKHVSIYSLWTCGVREKSYASGELDIHGNLLEIVSIEENQRTRAGELVRLRNGHLQYELPYCEEGHVVVEFARDENAVSFFDLFGWN